MNTVELLNVQNVRITSHVDLTLTPSIQSGSCNINILAKTVSSGGVFDYATQSGTQGKIIFTNYIGSCILRLIATFSNTAGTVIAGQSCSSTNNPTDRTRVIKASSVSFVDVFPTGSITGGTSHTYSRTIPHIIGCCGCFHGISSVFVFIF
jgi:hypothetical protein